MKYKKKLWKAMQKKVGIKKPYERRSPGVILRVFFWNCEGGYFQRHENQWKSIKINKNQWKLMKIDENQWKSLKINEIHWKSLENQWKSMNIYENQ